jgi:hypothetical protein
MIIYKRGGLWLMYGADAISTIEEFKVRLGVLPDPVVSQTICHPDNGPILRRYGACID